MWVILRQGKVFKTYDSPQKCVGEIFIQGWYVPERFGMIFIKGVEIQETKDGVVRSSGEALKVS